MSDTKEMFEAYVALVAKLVQEELNNLPRGVYHLSQAMKNKVEEHPNYNFLPETSILRAIIGHFLTPSRPFDLDKSLLEILANLENRQGHLKIWTEHSPQSHFFEITLRGQT